MYTKQDSEFEGECHRELMPVASVGWRLRLTRPTRHWRTTDSKKAPLGRLSTLVGRAGFEPATN